ncbi:endoglucanase [Nocardioides sp. dk4132]|uniref:glycoside hydrolase family 6 protein n=1 Tax=unclassified Nocardioides TaxID=2615069 RepID=UPI0012975FDA|nr:MULTISPECIES: glycoside hydrolase family 6 protein [unclassified Nocardioides]MQW77004.1 endoglucanase [Nocardioides sp. dk4132]QGA09416.1 endoglucanase [Nocardioides sp. dk884]
MTPRLLQRWAGLVLAGMLAPALVTAATAVPAFSPGDAGGVASASERARKDPRLTRPLYVDARIPAAMQESRYARIAQAPQATWYSPEQHPTSQVAWAVSDQVARAKATRSTPVLVLYAIPDRDCGQHSVGGLPDAAAYRAYVRAFTRGLGTRSKAMVVVEPDAIPFVGEPDCADTAARLKMLRFAVTRIARTGAWAYLDAGHSAWTPYDGRAQLLKRAGIAKARGFSTNVANFRPLRDERAYAVSLGKELARIGVKGARYVVDTSRNGAAAPIAGDVINPTWARLGPAPKRRFQGALDATLWIKHPGESDGAVNGGNAAGQWCDLLADRLSGRAESPGC